MEENIFIQLSDGTSICSNIYNLKRSRWVVCVHGVGEHMGRNGYLPEVLSSEYNVIQFDLRGHGKSEGRRGYISDFNQYAKDLAEIIRYFNINYQMENFSVFGHSMGGLIVADYIQNRVESDLYPQKIFLSSPAIGVPVFPGNLLYKSPLSLTGFLSRLKISIPMQGFVDLRMLSHDYSVYKLYMKDKLNCLKIHTSIGFGLVQRSREVFSRPLNAKCQIYASVGTKDVLVSPEAFENYFSNIEPTAKILIVKDGYHELSNEIDKYRRPYIDFLKSSFFS